MRCELVSIASRRSTPRILVLPLLPTSRRPQQNPIIPFGDYVTPSVFVPRSPLWDAQKASWPAWLGPANPTGPAHEDSKKKAQPPFSPGCLAQYRGQRSPGKHAVRLKVRRGPGQGRRHRSPGSKAPREPVPGTCNAVCREPGWSQARGFPWLLCEPNRSRAILRSGQGAGICSRV